MLKRLVVLTLCSVFGMAGQALAVNFDFETGDTTGWTAVIPPGGSITVVTTHTGGTSSYSPEQGTYFAELKTDGPGSVTTLSQTFALSAGQSISGTAAFDAHDYMPYNDSASVSILFSNVIIDVPWSASVFTVGDNTSGQWTPWSFVAPFSGSFTVQYQIANALDSIGDSHALFDAVPEPSTLLLLGLGLTALGVVGRKRS